MKKASHKLPVKEKRLTIPARFKHVDLCDRFGVYVRLKKKLKVSGNFLF